jgi:uncharacterized membrane protein YvbJ
MFCSKCGSKSLDGAEFCQKCGAKLITGSTPPQVTQLSNGAEREKPSDSVDTTTASPVSSGLLLLSQILTVMGGLSLVTLFVSIFISSLSLRIS